MLNTINLKLLYIQKISLVLYFMHTYIIICMQIIIMTT